jgi:hypothetical protein
MAACKAAQKKKPQLSRFYVKMPSSCNRVNAIEALHPFQIGTPTQVLINSGGIQTALIVAEKNQKPLVTSSVMQDVIYHDAGAERELGDSMHADRCRCTNRWNLKLDDVNDPRGGVDGRSGHAKPT